MKDKVAIELLKDQVNLGDTVLVPLKGEEENIKQICLEHEVVLCLKSKDGDELIEFDKCKCYKL